MIFRIERMRFVFGSRFPSDTTRAPRAHRRIYKNYCIASTLSNIAQNYKREPLTMQSVFKALRLALGLISSYEISWGGRAAIFLVGFTIGGLTALG